MIRELVDGEGFTTVEPTPRLIGCIEAAATALGAAVPGAEIRRSHELRFGSGTALVPSLAVFGSGAREDGARPDLVVEFRVESTSRYVLGPKRLVYSRNRVPELWFVDPWRSRVGVLEAGEAGKYGWPPRERLPGEVLEPRRLPGARVAVADLLAGWPPGRGREPEPGEEWWEAS